MSPFSQDTSHLRFKIFNFKMPFYLNTSFLVSPTHQINELIFYESITVYKINKEKIKAFKDILLFVVSKFIFLSYLTLRQFN